jgi:hypothetical protein
LNIFIEKSSDTAANASFYFVKKEKYIQNRNLSDWRSKLTLFVYNRQIKGIENLRIKEQTHVLETRHRLQLR